MTLFPCFLIYDYLRDYSFMFIRRGFQVNPEWRKERSNLETGLKKLIKQPPQFHQFTTEFGRYLCYYDHPKSNVYIQLECYFVLLCNSKLSEELGWELLDRLFNKISTVPKYSQIRKDVAETQLLGSLRQMIDEYESQCPKLEQQADDQLSYYFDHVSDSDESFSTKDPHILHMLQKEYSEYPSTILQPYREQTSIPQINPKYQQENIIIEESDRQHTVRTDRPMVIHIQQIPTMGILDTIIIITTLVLLCILLLILT